MSPIPRLILGIALILIAAGFLALVPIFAAAGDAFPPQTKYVLGCLAVFCGLGAVACFPRASHPVTIRIIGGTVFATCLAYVTSQALDEAPAPAKQAQQPGHPIAEIVQRRGRPSLVNSLAFFVLVGLPSGYSAIAGRYPGWGRHASAFGGWPVEARAVGLM